ncbi:REP element-mobilizing transposase RayT [Paucibacter oligotrophus]|uniref:REP element-mobilizing transposase RayT n=1 Tax=Roseateles oligotrophus TaxID=1769250 RepID=A0A840LJ77_9BURK|nr:transposase [Roseateles oligotrophus]MBB4846268.1 REP element-mobilizing transposase RayT [Roseateles oligotrophus]
MARPLRIEFPGAIYHLTARGDRREDIFVDDKDRALLLTVLAQGMARFDAVVLAYCLMGNHYHFVVQTRSANLSLLMRHINGVYTQAYNRRHGKVGHLFQGRYKAILIDRDAYLLEACRYVELNPVRAGMVAGPGDWVWSSYRAHTAVVPAPAWLDSSGLHSYLLGQAEPPTSEAERVKAGRSYAQWVADGMGVQLWAAGLNRQVFLGDNDFVLRMHDQADVQAKNSTEVPKAQRSRPQTLGQWQKVCDSREEALRCAYVHSGITMTALAAEIGLTVARVSQLIARAEAGRLAMLVGDKGESRG